MDYKDIIAADSIKYYFDDMLGFNFIIDDTGMNEVERSAALTKYVSQVEKALNSRFNIKIDKLRKESRVLGFEAVNFSIKGWLNHKDLGELAVKIQFRFKTALYRESAMYYVYKKYGRWELPPWAKNIDFGGIETFRELQEMLFNNFKAYFPLPE